MRNRLITPHVNWAVWRMSMHFWDSILIQNRYSGWGITQTGNILLAKRKKSFSREERILLEAKNIFDDGTRFCSDGKWKYSLHVLSSCFRKRTSKNSRKFTIPRVCEKYRFVGGIVLNCTNIIFKEVLSKIILNKKFLCYNQVNYNHFFPEITQLFRYRKFFTLFFWNNTQKIIWKNF